MQSDLDSLSKSQVKRAGSVIRRLYRSDQPSFQEIGNYSAALEVVRRFRAAHATPLIVANNSLRSMLRTADCRVEVTQRLKRFRTIIDKITARESTLALSEMQDIGGVRAVVDSIADIRAVESRMHNTGRVIGYKDYVERPRASGYRGVHVIMDYRDRKIEVQLRTDAMHGWAVTVEQVSARLQMNFKQDGSHPMQLLFKAVSDVVAISESGEDVPEELTERLGRAWNAAGLGPLD